MWKCSYCNKTVNPPRRKCPFCTNPTNIPSNVALAGEDEQYLEKRFQDCLQDCDNEQKKLLLEYAHILKQKISISINLYSGSLINLLQDDRILYLNFHDTVRAKYNIDPELIAKRKGIDSLMFGKDGENLTYGALNLCTIGLVSYGPACIFLKVDNNIQKNISFIESNSFNYLGPNGIYIPHGSRALWHTVHKLVIVKHKNDLLIDKKLNHIDLANLILSSRGDKEKDHFIEAQILQPITRSSISRIIYSPSHDKSFNISEIENRSEGDKAKLIREISECYRKVISFHLESFLPGATFEVIE